MVIVETVLLQDFLPSLLEFFTIHQGLQPPIPVAHLSLVTFGQPPAQQLPHPLGRAGKLRQVMSRLQLLENQVNPGHIRPQAQAYLIFQVFPDVRGGRDRGRGGGERTRRQTQ